MTAGEAVATRLKAFNVGTILYTGRAPRPAGDELGAEFVDIDTLLARADIVVVTCALTDDTRGERAKVE